MITVELTWLCAPRKFIRQGKKLGTSLAKKLVLGRGQTKHQDLTGFRICISLQLLGFLGIHVLAQGLPAGTMDPIVI